MALGRRKSEQQDELFIMAEHLPKAPGHVFYRKLNAILAEAGFDRWVEDLCKPYYDETQGRPGIPPGTYFRRLLIGYFEGIGSQRGIAWRCSDSLSLRDFLAIPLTEDSPDHSTLSVVRRSVSGVSLWSEPSLTFARREGRGEPGFAAKRKFANGICWQPPRITSGC